MASVRERPRIRPPRPPSAMSAASFTADAIDRLTDLTKCQQCNALMVDPRQLPCHHSFCASCIRDMISSATRNEFLCPIDRTIIPVPAHGMDAFPSDQRLNALEDIRIDLEQSLLLEEPETADLDINLESLNKGVKDIEHSSAMSQHEVNSMFENIYKLLKKKQDAFLDDIKRKGKKQVSLLEFEKFRLIETKKYQNEQLNDSTFYEEDVNVIFQSFGNESINNTNPPSPNSSMFSRTRNTASTASDHRLSLMSCHIGQQQLEFQANQGAVRKLEEHLDELGRVVCDFDLKIKLDRNLLALSDYPFGMKIGGEENHSFEWQANQPKGISKRQMSTSLYVVNSGRSEIIQMDNSFNVMRVISGRSLFSNNLSDVASCGSHIYVADAGACQILMLNEDGTLVKRVGKPGAGNLEFKRPNGICVDSRGRVIVSDSLNHRIKVLSADLQKCVLTITSDSKRFREDTRFSFPCGVTVDKDDNIYVVDNNNKRLVQVSKTGKFMKEIFPADVDDPRCVAVSSDQLVLLTDRENAQLLIFDVNGNTTCRVSGIMDSQGREVKFKQPYGVVVDGTDKVYVTDIELNAVFVL